MPETEVSLGLALWLVEHGLVSGVVEIAIDGAQVRTGNQEHSNPRDFLARSGWNPNGGIGGWQGEYRSANRDAALRLHSTPGIGDVVATYSCGMRLRVECKKGPLLRSQNSVEYRLLREALGQMLTVDNIDSSDVLAVAVPHGERFAELAKSWGPRVHARSSIHILTVDPKGEIREYPALPR